MFKFVSFKLSALNYLINFFIFFQLAICLIALVASVSAKPHLLTTGVSYATPAVVAHPVVAQPVVSHAVVAQPVVSHAVAAHPVVARPVVAATALHAPVVAAGAAVPAVPAAYYPNYAASYATYPQYAAYPHLGGAAYFVRR